MRKTLEFAHQEPEFLEFSESKNTVGRSSLYITPAMIGKTRTLYAFGKITVVYDTPSGRKEVEYQIDGDEVFVNGQKYTDTPIYIRETDYLYMVNAYRTFTAFKEQFDKGKFYRRCKTPVPLEATRVVRHFEIWFGKSIVDVYVTFYGGVYLVPREGSSGSIVEMDIGWSIQRQTSDDLDLECILDMRSKDPILLTDLPPEEPEPEPEPKPDPEPVNRYIEEYEDRPPERDYTRDLAPWTMIPDFPGINTE